MVFGLIGNSGLRIQVEIHPNPQSIQESKVVQLDHQPSWKVSKNPFLSAFAKKELSQNVYKSSSATVPPTPPPPQQQMNNGVTGYVQGSFSNQIVVNNSNTDFNTNMIQPPLYQQQYSSGYDQGTYNYNANIDQNIIHNSQNNFNPSMIQQQQPQTMGFTPTLTMDRYGNQREVIYAFGESEDVQGVVHLFLPPGKRFEHSGIKIQFIGRVDMSHAVYEGRLHYDFVSLVKEVSPPSTLYQPQTTIPFFFRGDKKHFETYHGRNISVRYFVQVLVDRKFLPPVKHDREMIIQLVKNEPRLNNAIKMEVGIEECLHIEFQYKKRYYHLEDVIEGNIHFMLVRIKIKHMELAVIRREMSGEGLMNNSNHTNGIIPLDNKNSGSVVTETQTLTRFEIMDGAPVKGEVIPVRLYLAGIAADLTPTYDSPQSRFAVKYYLNLVLVDEEDRRYFKQQEIFLWRSRLG